MSQKSGERSRTPGASCLFNFVYSIRSKSRISEKGEGGGDGRMYKGYVVSANIDMYTSWSALAIPVLDRQTDRQTDKWN